MSAPWGVFRLLISYLEAEILAFKDIYISIVNFEIIYTKKSSWVRKWVHYEKYSIGQIYFELIYTQIFMGPKIGCIMKNYQFAKYIQVKLI